MTEQVPEPEEPRKKQPRDAAFWERWVERLEVSDVPEGAANVNVQGRREVGALQGWQTLAEDVPGTPGGRQRDTGPGRTGLEGTLPRRSEEHTSELQSRQYLV